MQGEMAVLLDEILHEYKLQTNPCFDFSKNHMAFKNAEELNLNIIEIFGDQDAAKELVMLSLFDFQSHLVKQFLWKQLGDFMESDYRPFLIKKLLSFQEQHLLTQEQTLVEELDKSFPIIKQLKSRQGLERLLEVLPVASIFVTIQFTPNMDSLYVGLAIKPITNANELPDSGNSDYFFDIRKFEISFETRKLL